MTAETSGRGGSFPSRSLESKINFERSNQTTLPLNQQIKQKIIGRQPDRSLSLLLEEPRQPEGLLVTSSGFAEQQGTLPGFLSCRKTTFSSLATSLLSSELTFPWRNDCKCWK